MSVREEKSRKERLENWLQDNPDHPQRTLIETDLRKLKEELEDRTYERDTFDLREHNFYNV